MSDLTVAQTIAKQIGGRAFFMMGTRRKLGGPDFLLFDIRGSERFNKVQVTLDSSDTYIVEFFKIGNRPHFRRLDYYSISDIYCEQLRSTIEYNTGRALQL